MSEGGCSVLCPCRAGAGGRREVKPEGWLGAGSSVAGLGRLDVTLCTWETSGGFQVEGIRVSLGKKPNMLVNGIVEAGRWGGRQEAGVEKRRLGGKEEAGVEDGRLGWRMRGKGGKGGRPLPTQK